MSVSPTSPAELFGGTWVALDQGRVLIGAGTSHPAGEEGGSENHALTTAEMPSHNHSGNASLSGNTGSAGGHSHGGSTSDAGSHRHTLTIRTIKTTSSASTTVPYDYNDDVLMQLNYSSSGTNLKTFSNPDLIISEGNSGLHGHTISTSTVSNHSHSLSGVSASITTDNTGSGQAHSIMQPYLSVYMWKRTA